MSNRYNRPFNPDAWGTVTIALTVSTGIHEHPIADVVPAAPMGRGARAFPGLVPGGMVRHVDDGTSFGMLVSTSEGRCSVLWSSPPTPKVPDVDIEVTSQAINAPSRRLKVRWTAEETNDMRALFNMELLSEEPS